MKIQEIVLNLPMTFQKNKNNIASREARIGSKWMPRNLFRWWRGWGEYVKRGKKYFCEVERSGSYSSTASATPYFEYLKTDEP